MNLKLSFRTDRSAAKTQRIIGLAKYGPGSRFAIEERGFQRSAIHTWWNRNAEKLQDRGRDIYRTHLLVNHSAGLLVIRQLHNQWNVRCRIVEKNAVRIFTMFAQPFPVVSD